MQFSTRFLRPLPKPILLISAPILAPFWLHFGVIFATFSQEAENAILETPPMVLTHFCISRRPKIDPKKLPNPKLPRKDSKIGKKADLGLQTASLLALFLAPFLALFLRCPPGEILALLGGGRRNLGWTPAGKGFLRRTRLGRVSEEKVFTRYALMQA